MKCYWCDRSDTDVEFATEDTCIDCSPTKKKRKKKEIPYGSKKYKERVLKELNDSYEYPHSW